MIIPNYTRINDSTYVVFTQAGFKQSAKQYYIATVGETPTKSEYLKDLQGHPTTYPCVVMFEEGYTGYWYTCAQCYGVYDYIQHLEYKTNAIKSAINFHDCIAGFRGKFTKGCKSIKRLITNKIKFTHTPTRDALISINKELQQEVENLSAKLEYYKTHTITLTNKQLIDTALLYNTDQYLHDNCISLIKEDVVRSLTNEALNQKGIIIHEDSVEISATMRIIIE